MKVAALLLILVQGCFASISFHASAVNEGTTGSWTQNLPSVSNGDVVIAQVYSATGSNNGQPPYAAISGWTAGCDQNAGSIFYRIWHTGDATTITYVPQNGADIAGNQQTATIVSYSGSSGLDGKPNCFIQYAVGLGSSNYFLYVMAPAVTPTSTNDVWLGGFAELNSNFGFSVTCPSGTTNRADSAGSGAPAVVMCEKALSSGANTGNFYATPPPNGGVSDFGAGMLLKPASGGSAVSTASIPTLGGIISFTGSSYVYGVGGGAALFPQDGDLLVYVNCNNPSGVTASGWSTITSQTNFTALSLLWRTGGPTTITPGGSYGTSNTSCNYLTIVRNNQFPASGQAPVLDAYEIATPVIGSTITLPSMSLASANEVLAAWFWDSTAFSNPLFSTPTNLHYILGILGSGALQDGNTEDSEITPANPTGTLSSTNSSSGSDTIHAALIAFKIGPTLTRVNHRTLMIDQF